MLVIACVVASLFPVESPLFDEGRSFAFTDGARQLALVRGDVRGRDDARVPGWLIDVATGRQAPVLVGHTVIVRLSALDERALGERALDALEVRVVRALMPSLEMVLVESTRASSDGALEDAAELVARIGGYPNLGFRKRAFDAAIVAPPFVPDDPRYPSQFYLDEIEIEAAWAITQGDASIEVLVADNGCDLVHPDLAAKMLPGFDPFDDDGDPTFEEGQGNEHGTACAGIIAASTDNGTDIAGTCPACSLRCARLLPADDEISTVASDVLTFQFALETDVAIVSNSWGFIDAIPVPAPLRDAIVEVSTSGRGGKGAVVLFASGNDSRLISDDELLAVPGIIGVGAVNSLGELTQFSNGGGSVDIVAPTGTITTDISGAGGADPTDVTVTFGGTSSACPVVAGVVGLMLANDPELSVEDITAALIGTARQSIFATPTDDGHDDYYGFGLVQPAQALAFFDAPPDVPPPPECTCANATSANPPVALAALFLLLGLLRKRGPRSFGA